MIDPTRTPVPASGLPATPTAQPPRSAEEAAARFEEVFVKQFVGVMTDGLFRTSMAGSDAPGWMSGYQDTQRDMLRDTLAGHLTDGGGLGIADRLVRQWRQAGLMPEPPADASTTDLPLER